MTKFHSYCEGHNFETPLNGVDKSPTTRINSADWEKQTGPKIIQFEKRSFRHKVIIFSEQDLRERSIRNGYRNVVTHVNIEIATRRADVTSDTEGRFAHTVGTS